MSSTMPKTTKLYLIRHAQPKTLQYKNYFPGPSLGTTGKLQAQKIAAYLRDKNINQVYASDFIRVKETLQPFLAKTSKAVVPVFEKSLWEREKEIESHESLVLRVNSWISIQSSTIIPNTAIFSHCGPINMILQYFDPDKEKLDYPYTCPHGCHTPLAGIWELELQTFHLVHGKLIFIENLE